MPRILTLFTQNYPQIDLQAQVASTKIIATNIQNQKLDVAIIGGEIAKPLEKKLTVHPFVYDELSLIISNSHPFAVKKVIKKEDLYCLDFITLNSNLEETFNLFIENHLEKNEFNLV